MMELRLLPEGSGSGRIHGQEWLSLRATGTRAVFASGYALASTSKLVWPGLPPGTTARLSRVLRLTSCVTRKIESDAPSDNGWEFVARLDWEEVFLSGCEFMVPGESTDHKFSPGEKEVFPVSTRGYLSVACCC